MLRAFKKDQAEFEELYRATADDAVTPQDEHGDAWGPPEALDAFNRARGHALPEAPDAVADPDQPDAAAAREPLATVARPALTDAEVDDARSAWQLCLSGRAIPTVYRPAAEKVARYMLARAYAHEKRVDRFPIFVHPDGAREGYPGVVGENRMMTVKELRDLLGELTATARPKESGPFMAPGHSRITNTHVEQRTEVNCASVGALFLDADNVGDWHDTLRVLSEHGAARLYNRSSGHCPTGCDTHRDPSAHRPAPAIKWHLILPLRTIWTPDGCKSISAARAQWKEQYYPAARFALHVLGDLSGKGFDPPLSQMLSRLYPGAPRPGHPPVDRELKACNGFGFDIAACWNALVELGVADAGEEKQRIERAGAPDGKRSTDWTANGDPPMVAAFKAAPGMYLGAARKGHNVVCPWADKHSDGREMAWLSPDGVFDCKHTHTEGKGKGWWEEVLGKLPDAAREAWKAANKAMQPSAPARVTSAPVRMTGPTLVPSESEVVGMVGAAKVVIETLPARAKADGAARAALSSDILDAALTLHRYDLAEYAQLKMLLRDLKVPASDWKTAMERRQAATQAQSHRLRAVPGVASASPGAVPPPPPDAPPDAPPGDDPDDGPDVFELGDADELARTLLDDMRRQCGTTVGLIYDEFQWWYFSGAGVWKPFEGDPHNIVSSYSGRDVEREDGKGTKALKLPNGAIEGAVKNAIRLAAKPGFFAERIKGVVFRNGFMAMRESFSTVEDKMVWTMALEMLAPEHRARTIFPFDYMGDQVCPPKFGKMLTQIFYPALSQDEHLASAEEQAAWDKERREDAEDRIELLLQYVGLCMMGLGTHFQCVLVLYGIKASNGKSTIMEIIEKLFPVDAVAALPPHEWNNHFNLTQLLNKSVNIAGEIPHQDLSQTNIFKSVVTSDPVTMAFKNKDAFKHRPQCGHIFGANGLPGTSDYSDGFFRRYAIVCCDGRFTDEDGNIDRNIAKTIIASELPQIAAACLWAARRALTDGKLTIPASSKRVKQEWKDGTDQVRGFVSDCCNEIKKGDTGSTVLEELYGRYVGWTRATGHRPMAQNLLGARLNMLGYKRASHKVCRGYKLTLKPKPMELDNRSPPEG